MGKYIDDLVKLWETPAEWEISKLKGRLLRPYLHALFLSCMERFKACKNTLQPNMQVALDRYDLRLLMVGYSYYNDNPQYDSDVWVINEIYRMLDIMVPDISAGYTWNLNNLYFTHRKIIENAYKWGYHGTFFKSYECGITRERLTKALDIKWFDVKKLQGLNLCASAEFIHFAYTVLTGLGEIMFTSQYTHGVYSTDTNRILNKYLPKWDTCEWDGGGVNFYDQYYRDNYNGSEWKYSWGWLRAWNDEIEESYGSEYYPNDYPHPDIYLDQKALRKKYEDMFASRFLNLDKMKTTTYESTSSHSAGNPHYWLDASANGVTEIDIQSGTWDMGDGYTMTYDYEHRKSSAGAGATCWMVPGVYHMFEEVNNGLNCDIHMYHRFVRGITCRSSLSAIDVSYDYQYVNSILPPEHQYIYNKTVKQHDLYLDLATASFYNNNLPRNIRTYISTDNNYRDVYKSFVNAEWNKWYYDYDLIRERFPKFPPQSSSYKSLYLGLMPDELLTYSPIFKFKSISIPDDI